MASWALLTTVLFVLDLKNRNPEKFHESENVVVQFNVCMFLDNRGEEKCFLVFYADW